MPTRVVRGCVVCAYRKPPVWSDEPPSLTRLHLPGLSYHVPPHLSTQGSGGGIEGGLVYPHLPWGGSSVTEG